MNWELIIVLGIFVFGGLAWFFIELAGHAKAIETLKYDDE